MVPWSHHHALILGAGRSGLAAARLLQDCGATVVLADDKEGPVLPSLLAGKTLLVLSPGVPRKHPVVLQALATNIPIKNEIEIALPFLKDCRFVGVTGTNGKSTTVTMLGAIAKVFDPQAFVGGNLGTPLCEAVTGGQKPNLCILELSSFQLETLHDLQLDAAIITNLAPDHIDRYDSVEDYYQTKLRIADLLRPGGVLIRENHFDFDTAKLDNPAILGDHNRKNAAAAVAAAVALGISREIIQAGVNAYRGIEHRLERLGEIDGVLWVNDTKATNVEAATTAVNSFSGGIHLILGGLGKGTSYQPLLDACQNKIIAIYAIGQEAPKVFEVFGATFEVFDAKTLDQAAALAHKNAKPSEVILLAPACASFDQFANFIERGETFRVLFERFKKG